MTTDNLPMLAHDFDEYGSLASPCKRCGLEFTIAVDHLGWSGVSCQVAAPYTPYQKHQFTRAYMAHLDFLDRCRQRELEAR